MSQRDLARARFPRLQAGYESWFLRAAHPSGRLGVWIRYTVHHAPGRPATGSLWFTLFDAGAPAPTTAKVTLVGPRTDDASWLRVGDATIGPRGARGQIEDGTAGPVGWELTFPGDALFAHLPHGWMYDAPLPRTKPVSLHPAARVSGTLTVGDRVVPLDGWPGTVGHNWGSEHAERWIWLHATGFEDDGLAWLDVVLARLRLGRWTTPWSGFGALSLDGDLHRLGGLSRVRSTRVEERPDRLDLALTGRGLQVHGRVSARHDQLVGWVYADPDGHEHDVTHCSIADLDLVVDQHGLPTRTLRAAGVAAYELGMREHDHGVPVQPFPDG